MTAMVAQACSSSPFIEVWMSAPSPYIGSETIIATNGSGLAIAHIGSSISTPTSSLQLTNVLHDKRTGQILFTDLSHNGLYPMPLPSFVHTAFLGQNSFSSAPHMCQPCLKGKFTKLPFVLAKSKSTIPFETVHSDVWGPAPGCSLEVKNSKWQHAMQDEFDALQKQRTWHLVPLPPIRNLVGCKWVYRLKRNPYGSMTRYKARLVAKGFSQVVGLDYGETFSPVVKHTTVHLVLASATTFGWKLHQLDVKNAFLHGILQEEVYMSQPQGFVDPLYPHHVCRLDKSLYALKQALRAWNERFTSYIPCIGFRTSEVDPSLFVKQDGPSLVLLLLYVDDIILTSFSPAAIASVITLLSKEFDMTNLGHLHYFLGLQIQYTDAGISVTQFKYIKDVLSKANLSECKPCVTLSHPNHKLLRDGNLPFSDPTHFRSLVGALQYLTLRGLTLHIP
ncbi:hypothetical protein L3X38_025901 [Prunus dulcis]|uniref:Reverse transcriptase Ty1/copia-type domain-containing protein n=1 Tax=Prunus dulcis TaxID=3755 RepID=A0AAD4Z6V2_PRUDU|nr:hypothetical protein L3X38_025901 [Prunus dulcis]